MRFELAGQMTPSGPPNPGNPSNPPAVLLTYNADDTLDLKSYADMGYTTVDVICIGAGGGMGGHYDVPSIFITGDAGQYSGVKYYGGAGGGGGLHKITASLLGLPDTVDIVVGQGGVAGTPQSAPDVHSSPRSGVENTTCTDGSDGGYSSFNDTTCRASGGKGGKSPKHITWSGSNSNFMNGGGDGGVGNSITAGGGGHGAVQFSSIGGVVTPIVQATQGIYDGTVGGGGGGGAGGGVQSSAHSIGPPFDTPVMGDSGFITISPTNGSAGCYDPTDLSVFVPGSSAGQDPAIHIPFGANPIPFPLPGKAGGANASPLNGLSTAYGSSIQVPLASPGLNGVVVVLLSAK